MPPAIESHLLPTQDDAVRYEERGWFASPVVAQPGMSASH